MRSSRLARQVLRRRKDPATPRITERDESGTGRDESDKSRDESATGRDESAARGAATTAPPAPPTTAQRVAAGAQCREARGRGQDGRGVTREIARGLTAFGFGEPGTRAMGVVAADRGNQRFTSRTNRPVGKTGFERTAILPIDTGEADSECAHLCASSEIPAFVAASGRLCAWDELPEHLRGRLTSLDPDVLTALHALFCGAPRQQ